ncbi:Hsp20/alpha crystallin family protein [Vibrio sp. L5-1]|jgi:HSP20 family protein|uniref:Hsp20/alpha crystallin family protein n=1 Tax=Vibrio qingdaonensis TaxID=2829491 RepID=A0A9X3CSU5_9VIBR|nr:MULTISPECIES: Hsp20/alpha crystallin family protein [Vibrio]MCF7498259.1 Hsp20/alpha crystallin family protein [Vibrio sp. L5-1]MCW8349121.1 Hsp20/alpha crystallin family protein [Vibrio qingdaonensis]
MNIEKLTPWNWFKHEDDSKNQIPVSKNEAFSEVISGENTIASSQKSALGSLIQLQNQMDRLFEEAWQRFGIQGFSHGAPIGSLLENNLFGPQALYSNRAKLDISSSENGYEISVELPGLSDDEIQVELSANTLIVKGQMQEEKESKDKQYYRMERSMGTFQRTLSLPEDIDKDNISASMKNGLLVIQIPRKATKNDNVKRISISS